MFNNQIYDKLCTLINKKKVFSARDNDKYPIDFVKHHSRLSLYCTQLKNVVCSDMHYTAINFYIPNLHTVKPLNKGLLKKGNSLIRKIFSRITSLSTSWPCFSYKEIRLQGQNS